MDEFTDAVRLPPKGQITIPDKIREDFGLATRDVLYISKANGTYEVAGSSRWVAKTAGVFAEYAKGKPIFTDEDMDEAIVTALVQNWNTTSLRIEDGIDE